MPKTEEISAPQIGTSDSRIRRAMSAAIARCADKRKEIADELGAAVGERITKTRLDDYTATSKPVRRFPAAWICAFCELTGSDELARCVLPKHLLDLLAIGESVVGAAGSLKRAHEAVSRIIEQPRQKKGKDKPSRSL